MEESMKVRPIIMGAESVQAILDGRKIMTRRVVNPQPEWFPEVVSTSLSSGLVWPLTSFGGQCGMPLKQKYHIGDLLWVRETWTEATPYQNSAVYKATYEYPQDFTHDWKSPIYMPRWASRITLEITDIRVERVQEICWDDCIREGVCSLTLPEDLGNQELYEWLEKKSAPRPLIKSIEDLRESYRVAWNDLNAKRGYSWKSNPWVWVLTFKVVS
jgi:hypothetical protein